MIMEMIIGALLLLIGMSIGVTADRMLLYRTTPVQSRKIEAICSCYHPFSMHTEKRGCMQELSRRGSGGYIEWVKCACVKYTGPVPINEIWVPPVLPPPGATS